MKLSFIIITWNGKQLISDCLKSISSFIGRPDIEILVVDNGSTDGTVEFLKSRYPDIRLFLQSENRGVAAARNIALKAAKGDYLFIIDNDLILNDVAVEGMMQFIESHTDVGICGCLLRDAYGNIQPSAKKYPGIWMKLRNILRSGRYNYTYDLTTCTEPFEPVYIIGACQLVRRMAFEEVGLLDEHIFYGPEDADFCLRMHAKNWKVMFLPQYEMVHYCQRVTNKRIFSSLGRKHLRGLFYFYRKYKRLF